MIILDNYNNEDKHFKSVGELFGNSDLHLDIKYYEDDETGECFPVPDYAMAPEVVEGMTIKSHRIYLNKDYTKLNYFGCRWSALDDVASYLNDYARRNCYRFSMLYCTELGKFNILNNYDKTSEIRTDYSGSEKNETEYSGSSKHETDYAGSEKDETIKTGSEQFAHGLTQTNKVNGTNNSSALTTRTQDENSGTDTTTYNNVKDSLTKSFTNRKDTVTDSFTNRKDTDIKSFTNRYDTVTERTTGNIGVTTSAAMLVEARQLAEFSIETYIIDDFIREISIMA